MLAAAIVGGGGLFVSDNVWTTTKSLSLVAQAEARIGRPWTPLSVAGVARRQYRRAVVAGAVTGGVAAGYGYGYPYYSSGYSYPYYSSGYSDPYYNNYGYTYPSYSSGYSYPYYGYGYGRGLFGWRGWWR
jgi:hypothetical protein